MLSQSPATPAAAHAARRGLPFLLLNGAGLLLAAASLAACQPRTIAVAGADPADPAARVAPVRTSTVTSPYMPLRPTAPAAWGPRDGVPRSEPSR
ncbi:hypothetical protein [Bradyrhizobium sp. STM 3809]|uniref:hypothetical protein n=1 Tax=Bradyrhizobium sp. STM 3809 TaxID=551936 RepID=UPI0002405A43|nr:hypothetical protein [Bradyrhizobium sp. STM 3809]CCD98100.1 conserved exported hypothetical protein [Bradyrhizobium sp. STM 3809]